jgi:hypothetical protein
MRTSNRRDRTRFPFWLHLSMALFSLMWVVFCIGSIVAVCFQPSLALVAWGWIFISGTQGLKTWASYLERETEQLS